MQNPANMAPGSGPTVAAGQALAAARRAVGLRQEDLAERIGCDRSYVSSLERGQRNLSADSRAMFAAALDANALEIFAGFPPPRHRTDPIIARSGREPHDGPGERLRQARIAKGMTLAKLGERVGLDISWLARIENGHALPSGAKALALAEAVDVPDLFPLRPCPCRPRCKVLTVGGGYARGHGPDAAEARRKGGRKNRGRPRPYFSAWLRSAHRTPTHRFHLRMARWGTKGTDYAKRAAADLEEALRRRRGGAPQKAALHGRWLAMFNGEDVELEELLAADGMSRTRAIAWLDWQRHPEDWSREKWPASSSDREDIEPLILAGAKARVEKALQRARTKPLVR
jgi:transcriptional regulator with XRE-family HTH domain